MQTHLLGYPRIGSNRELKKACEQYWSGKISLQQLLEVGKTIRNQNWKLQQEAGIDLIPSNDFSYYDQVLDITAMEMTKWFDTNYHYIVPEFNKNQQFTLFSNKIVTEFIEAKKTGISAKPVIIGLVTYLLLGKEKEDGFDKLDLAQNILPAYIEILRKLEAQGAQWIQFDEPFLALDLDRKAKETYLYRNKKPVSQS